MNRHIWIGVLLAVALLAGCVDNPINESARLENQDSPQAVRIKARLLEEPDLAGSAIDVDLNGDQAILSGFVETTEQRERAEAISRDHERVKSVDNRITVK
ncbi:BON domain-containing protein [Halomonas daqiaonensis]|uniref:BON domain-containing protein n=1 Tax=Halomonas daqiaonensis TaxID=650850 RepID=A0A1H7RUM4_9GAMM|nr:BON domain-containing protein [Halomonas daqiaonensis]SEL63127.1 BON domain-containing protein [Halomonas daqiaonensis]